MQNGGFVDKGMDKPAKVSPSTPLSEVLERYAHSPDFIVYKEGMDKSKVDPGKCVAYRKFIVAMAEISPTLHFSNHDLTKALVVVAANKAKQGMDQGGWPRPLTVTELDDYKQKQSRRIRTLFRHVQRARTKHPSTSWVLRIFRPRPQLLLLRQALLFQC